MNEDLIKAAEYIDRHGWTTGTYRNIKGEVCMAGAVFQISDRVSHLSDFCFHKYGFDIIKVNDTILKSAEEASKLLREAAEWDAIPNPCSSSLRTKPLSNQNYLYK